MDNIDAWTQVITNPLGLAGFALFLVFGLLAKFGLKNKPGWIIAVALVMALIALVGGLSLAWKQHTAVDINTESTSRQTPHSNQITHGDKSPAIQNVEGDVIINFNEEETGN